MNIQTSSSRQLSANVMDGNNQMAAMFANFRPGKSLNINIEIMDEAYAQAHAAEIADAFDTFAADALRQARECGVPVNAPPAQQLASAVGSAEAEGDESALAPATR
ncbi:MAG: hypothetical protein RR482_00130 [Clostridia bacterium]